MNAGEHRGASSSSVISLLEENRLLRKQLASHVQLRQEVLALGNRLECETARFAALQRFMERAVQADRYASLATIVCESIIELFDCGVGILWNLRAPPGSAPDPLHHIGLRGADAAAALGSWIDDWMSSREGVRTTAPLPDCLGLDQGHLIEVAVDGKGRPSCILLACNGHAPAGNSSGFDQADARVFTTFARLVGVLMVSRARHETILRQIETIRVSEQRLHTALDSTNVGLWDWDMTAGTVYYSDQWKKQLGMGVDEVGDSLEEWRDRVHPDDLQMAIETVNHCMEHPWVGFDLTLRMRHRDGRWIWINTRGFHVGAESGGDRRMIGTHIDVTAQKLLESRLMEAERKQRTARRQAERESRAKSSFLAAVSHEIRTPLNGIMAAIQMLARVDDPAQRRKLLDTAAKAGQWMLRIIGESMDISRIEAGKMELCEEVADLPALLEEVRGLYEAQAAGGSTAFRWQTDGTLPAHVRIDPVRFKQVLANLIGNALKFTPSGTVTVRVSVMAAGKTKAPHLRLVVEDTGIGMEGRFRKIIFKPFAQVSQGRTGGGLGMGLVISRQIVSLMQGRIRVESEPGRGSRFEVTVPLHVVETPLSPASLLEVGNLPVFSGRVLLVEDDPVSGELGRMMLEALGLEVTQAVDGAEALASASRDVPDLIIMDCSMPVMDGIEATRHIRRSSNAKLRGLPVVALTAHARQCDLEECRAAGMDDFMTKPLLFDALIDVLGRHLHAPQSGGVCRIAG